MFVVVLEGFLTSSPQLILQLSLWFKGRIVSLILSVCHSLLYYSLSTACLSLFYSFPSGLKVEMSLWFCLSVTLSFSFSLSSARLSSFYSFPSGLKVEMSL